MSSEPSSASAREIVWPSVITVISAAILIAAEVFGGAFAGGWAFGVLFGLSETSTYILQAILFVLGAMAMFAFMRHASRIEPFFRRTRRN